MRIGLIGKFEKLHDEEYIARSFESLGHDVIRINQNMFENDIHRKIVLGKPDILIFTKWKFGNTGKDALYRAKEWGMKSVCWLFDLYWGYEREYRVKIDSYFKADYVITTDGGHDKEWNSVGIRHYTVRQGIYDKECVVLNKNYSVDVCFIGSENPFYPERTKTMEKLSKDFNFKWFGRRNTDEIRGMDLNKIFSKVKIIVGDSVYSPNYWSNRVVETLGRGGFLIHREVEGLKEEYPDLVTYDGSYEDLKLKIEYYLSHDEERERIIKKNFEKVKKHYTMIHKCKELLKCLNK